MKIIKLLPLAAAGLALNACSSEPSDWRADKKVSLDMVAPGTRISDNFDQNTPYAPNQAKGAAITKPINSGGGGGGLDRRTAPSAEASMSANSEETLRSKSKTDAAKIKAKPGQEDTARDGRMIER